MIINVKLIHRGYFVFLQLLFVSVVHAALPADVVTAAENGKASAQYSIARSYELGKRVKSDNAKAIEWYTKAADQGHTDAAYRLGLIYYKGVGGFQTDFKKAFHYISLAANKNHKNSQANLAKMYQNGDGVKRNEELSDYWYEQAFTAKIQPFSEYLKEQAQSHAPKVIPAKVKKALPVAKKPRKSAPSGSARKNKIAFPNTIIEHEWFQKGKASAYLNSAVAQCKVKNKKVICSSSKLKGVHSTGMYKYKVKSIITAGRNAKDIQITYRKLYTSVPEENIGGYDDENESAPSQQLVVGWEKRSHSISCRFESAKSILCRPVGEDAFYIKAK
jgi:Sel1 repeat